MTFTEIGVVIIASTIAGYLAFALWAFAYNYLNERK